MHAGAAASWMAPMIRRILRRSPRSPRWLLAAPALAAPKANTITAIGGMKVKANGYVQDDQRWDADTYTVKSGATVTLRDKSTMGQPHSLSLIKKLPKGDQAIMECKACGPLMEAHEANPETMEAGKALVEAGAAGFDAAGDSIWLPVQGQGDVQGHREEGREARLRVRPPPVDAGRDQGLLSGVAAAPAAGTPGAYRGVAARMSHARSCRCTAQDRRRPAALQSQVGRLAAGPHGADQRAAEAASCHATASRTDRSGSATSSAGSSALSANATVPGAMPTLSQSGSPGSVVTASHRRRPGPVRHRTSTWRPDDVVAAGVPPSTALAALVVPGAGDEHVVAATADEPIGAGPAARDTFRASSPIRTSLAFAADQLRHAARGDPRSVARRRRSTSTPARRRS